MKTLLFTVLITLTLVGCVTAAWNYRKVDEYCTAYDVMGKPFKYVISEMEMHETSWQWSIYAKICTLMNRKVNNKKRINRNLGLHEFEYIDLVKKFARALEESKDTEIRLIKYPNYMETENVVGIFDRLSFPANVSFRVKYYLLIMSHEGKTINCVVGDDLNEYLCILSYRDEDDKIINRIIR